MALPYPVLEDKLTLRQIDDDKTWFKYWAQMKEFVFPKEECCDEEESNKDAVIENVEVISFPDEIVDNFKPDKEINRKLKKPNRRVDYEESNFDDLRYIDYFERLFKRNPAKVHSKSPHNQNVQLLKPPYKKLKPSLGSSFNRPKSFLSAEALLPYLFGLSLFSGGLFGALVTSALTSIASSLSTSGGSNITLGSTSSTGSTPVTNIYINVSSVSSSNASVVNNITNSGSPPVNVNVDLTPLTNLLNQILTLLTGLLGGRGLDTPRLLFSNVLSLGPLKIAQWLLTELQLVSERHRRTWEFSLGRDETHLLERDICYEQLHDMEEHGYNILIIIARIFIESWYSGLPNPGIAVAVLNGIQMDCSLWDSKVGQ